MFSGSKVISCVRFHAIKEYDILLIIIAVSACRIIIILQVLHISHEFRLYVSS